jgi:4-azaleucine resistance transporter AzlC
MTSEFRAGLAAIAPVMAAAMPIGLLFGALAAEKGLGPGEVALMSLLVFAGAAQFVALDLWAVPLPVAAVVLATLVVNLRHVMMGLSLGRRLGGFTRPQRLGALYLMADEVWALAEARARVARLTPAYYAGLGLPLIAVWTATTAAGAAFGALLADPARFGFDFVFTALFIGLIAGFRKLPGAGFMIAASAIVSVAVHSTIGAPWHILAGGLAGAAVTLALPLRETAA